APAALRKEGPAYDLPIALGVLVAMGQVMPETFEGTLVMGELSLDGSVRHVRGVLPMTTLAREKGLRRVFVPAADAPPADTATSAPIVDTATEPPPIADTAAVAPLPPSNCDPAYP